MMPKMWNLTESPADAEFVRSLGGEFNPCVVTVRRGMTLVHMVHPLIVVSHEAEREDEGATLTVRHVPAPFAPFMRREAGDALVLSARDSYTLRFYEWPDMDKVSVWHMVPETNKPDFRILLQLALVALHTGFAQQLEAHGPFSGLEAALEDEAALEEATRVEAAARKLAQDRAQDRMWIAGEETIADTDDGAHYSYIGDTQPIAPANDAPDYTEREVRVGGRGVYQTRVVNGETVYVLVSSSADSEPSHTAEL
jgi:hypothetical protein